MYSSLNTDANMLLLEDCCTINIIRSWGGCEKGLRRESLIDTGVNPVKGITCNVLTLGSLFYFILFILSLVQTRII